jgi:hypothetical protein
MCVSTLVVVTYKCLEKLYTGQEESRDVVY